MSTTGFFLFFGWHYDFRLSDLFSIVKLRGIRVFQAQVFDVVLNGSGIRDVDWKEGRDRDFNET